VLRCKVGKRVVPPAKPHLERPNRCRITISSNGSRRVDCLFEDISISNSGGVHGSVVILVVVVVVMIIVEVVAEHVPDAAIATQQPLKPAPDAVRVEQPDGLQGPVVRRQIRQWGDMEP
jgi:hypothetical protein